jgi:hypothetical protein
MYTINEKEKEKEKEIPKKQGGHASCPNPKTCTQYKEK